MVHGPLHEVTGDQVTSFLRGQRRVGGRDVERATLRSTPTSFTSLNEQILVPNRGVGRAPGFIGTFDEDLDFFADEPRPAPSPAPPAPRLAPFVGGAASESPGPPGVGRVGRGPVGASETLDQPGFGITSGELSENEELGLQALGALPGLGLATGFTIAMNRLGQVGVVEDEDSPITQREAMALAGLANQDPATNPLGTSGLPSRAPSSLAADTDETGLEGPVGGAGPAGPDPGPPSSGGPASGPPAPGGRGAPGTEGPGQPGAPGTDTGPSGPGPGAGPGSEGGSGDGGDKIICTELFRQGMMPLHERMWSFRGTMTLCYPETVTGYHFWAIHVVHAIRRNPCGRHARFWAFMVRHRACELAFRMGLRDQPDHIGKAVILWFHPVSFTIGMVLKALDHAPNFNALYTDQYPRI